MKNSTDENYKLNQSILTDEHFERLAEALSVLKNSNLKTDVLVNGKLSGQDCFMTSRTFPFSVGELRTLNVVHEKWQIIIEAVPHLFQKQKVIYLTNGFLKASVADWLYKNQSEKKTIFLKSMKDFSFIKKKARNAVVFQEYKFNYSRFFIEVLKYFDQQGGEITFNVARSEFARETKPAVLLPVKTYDQFALVLKEKENLIFCTESGDSVLITSQKAPFPDASELSKVCENYFVFDPAKVEKTNVIQEPSLKNIHQVLTQIEERMDCCFESSDLNDYYDIGLDKFDLARQTGISYERFKTYFHRYGKGIDEITETAYHIMEQTRNSEAIWRIAELRFQEKYEWNSDRHEASSLSGISG